MAIRRQHVPRRNWSQGPELDALRQREDFQKLLAELAQNSSAPPPK
jgi:hypothetical protein